eukprot:jgi/Mesvir1/14835/Mv05461-RA.1
MGGGESAWALCNEIAEQAALLSTMKSSGGQVETKSSCKSIRQLIADGVHGQPTCMPVALTMVLAGANVEDGDAADSRSALHEAVKAGHRSAAAPSLVESLLSAGADANHLANTLEHTLVCIRKIVLADRAKLQVGTARWAELTRHVIDEAGACWTPLHSAAYAGDATMTRVLLSAPDIDVNIPGWHPHMGFYATPVAVAAARGHLDVMRALLDAGALVSPGFTSPDPLSLSFPSSSLTSSGGASSGLTPYSPTSPGQGVAGGPSEEPSNKGGGGAASHGDRINHQEDHPDFQEHKAVAPLENKVEQGKAVPEAVPKAQESVLHARVPAQASGTASGNSGAVITRHEALRRMRCVPAVFAATRTRQLAALTVLVREYGASINVTEEERGGVDVTEHGGESVGSCGRELPWNPLSHAITSRYPLAFVTAMLDLGADPRVADCLSLACMAANDGDREAVAVVDLLIAWEMARGGGRLRPAESFGMVPQSWDIGVVKRLLAAGWDVNSESRRDALAAGDCVTVDGNKHEGSSAPGMQARGQGQGQGQGYEGQEPCTWPAGGGRAVGRSLLEYACMGLGECEGVRSLALVQFLLDQGARAGLSRALLAACAAQPLQEGAQGATAEGEGKGKAVAGEMASSGCDDRQGSLHGQGGTDAASEEGRSHGGASWDGRGCGISCAGSGNGRADGMTEAGRRGEAGGSSQRGEENTKGGEATAKAGIYDHGELSTVVTGVVKMLLAAAMLPAAAGAAAPTAATSARLAPATSSGMTTRSRSAAAAAADAGRATRGAATVSPCGSSRRLATQALASAGHCGSANSKEGSAAAPGVDAASCPHSHVTLHPMPPHALTSLSSSVSPSLSSALSSSSRLDPRLVGDDDKHNALMLTCARGHAGAARLLLAAGCDPNFCGGYEGPRWSGTPLLQAVTHGHAAVVALLLASGARADSPLYTHTDEAHPRVHASLFDGYIDDDCVFVFPLPDERSNDDDYGSPMRRRICACDHPTSPLVAAASLCQPDCLRLLLEDGADPNARDRLGMCPFDALGRGYVMEGMSVLRLRDEAPQDESEWVGSPHSSMCHARVKRRSVCQVRADQLECLMLLVRAGALMGGAVDASSGPACESFLWRCVRHGLLDCLETLLLLGVNLFACHGGRHHNRHKGSVLHYAVSERCMYWAPHVLPVLLSAPGADPNWRGPKGRAHPPLFALARRLFQEDSFEEAFEAARILLEAGASADYADAVGRTSLHMVLHLDGYPGRDGMEDEVTAGYERLAERLIFHSKGRAEEAPCARHGTPIELCRRAARDPVTAWDRFGVGGWGRSMIRLERGRAARLLAVLERGEAIRGAARWARRKHFLFLRALAQRGRLEAPRTRSMYRSMYVTGEDADVCAHWLCEVAPEDIARTIIRLL